MGRSRLRPAELPDQIRGALRELEATNTSVYTGLSEEYKVAALAFSEVIRVRAEALMEFVRAGRRINHGIPVVNPVEVYGCDHRKPEDVAEYLYWLGVESGIQMLAGRLYGLMTGGRFRCFKRERHPTRVRWESDGGLMLPPRNLVRDEDSEAPPYCPPLTTDVAFHGAATYLGIPDEVFTRRGMRRDDVGGVEALPEPEPSTEFDDPQKKEEAYDACHA